MSLFQNVWIEINCEYCGKEMKTNVRFHGSAYLFADYELGEKVPEEDDLKTEEIYEANADRYCRDCLFKWSLEQAKAGYDALIQCIKLGVVEVKPHRASPPLFANEILDYRDKYINELKRKNTITVTCPFYTEFYLTFNGKLVRNKCYEENLDSWGDLLDIISPMIGQYLKSRNWHTSLDITKDYIVYLQTGTRRIFVEDTLGNKLLK